MNDVIFGSVTIGDVLALLGGGLGVSVIVQVVKRAFGLSSSKVVQFLVAATSVVGTGLADLISAVHGNPSILAGHSVEVLGVANAAHTFIVSDADAFLSKVKTALNDEQTQTKAVTPAPVAEPTATPQAPAENSF